MIRYGMMQGRLTTPKGRGIQFFPFDNWADEFDKATALGLQEIEWIFDFDDYPKNPLWTAEGTKAIQNKMDKTGVEIRAICFDYFMRSPFFKYQGQAQATVMAEVENVLDRIFTHMQQISATLIEIPLVDDASVKNITEEDLVISFLSRMASQAQKYKIRIGIESDYPPGEFRRFLERMAKEDVVANYDSGNSSGLGYAHKEEILSLKDLLYNVHIKDRQLHGPTVALGTGSANLDEVFASLKEIGYQGSLILQAARGKEGMETETIASQLVLVKEYVKQYRLERLAE